MFEENILTVGLKKRETALKLLIAAFTYCMLFAFLENPVYMTISLIGKKHIILFCIYCFIYGFSNIINFKYMFSSFGIKKNFLYYLMIFSNLCMGLVATTLMPNVTENIEITLFATIVHWVAGFGNILINATVVLIMSLNIYKKTASKKMCALTAAGITVCIADLLCFALMTVISGDPQKSKNGFYEIVPMAVTFAVLYFINHTDIAVPRSQRDEAQRLITPKDNRIFTAICFGSLIFAWIIFTNFAFVRNPIHYTISMTGIDYPIGFAITSFALAIAFMLNFIMTFRKYNYKNYFIWALAIIGSLSIIVCVIFPTTLGKNVDKIHAVSALLFFYFILSALLLFLIRQSKGSKKHLGFAVGTASIVTLTTLAVIFLFIIFEQRYGRTGLTEVIPLEFMFVYFLLENYTKYFQATKKSAPSADRLSLKK